MYEQFIEAALWADGFDLDGNDFEADQIDDEGMAYVRTVCDEFMRDNADDLKEAGLTPEQIAVDFWLTAGHHGAGFWDRGLGAVGDRLTDAAHAYSFEIEQISDTHFTIR